MSWKTFFILTLLFAALTIEGCLAKSKKSKVKSPSSESASASAYASASASASKSSPSSSSGKFSSEHTHGYKNKKYLLTSSNGIPKGYVDGTLCNRECDGRRMSCYFSFTLETFYSMSKACWGCPSPVSDCFREDCIVAGGVKRTVMVINRQLPGPAIEVCQGDEVMVHLSNHMLDGEATTIHWHGQHMKRDQYMDGVPFVTQCPIHFNSNFTYEFWADNAGTYWWHSHVEMQRGDGVFGCFIVRQPPKQNRHYNLYDTDLSSHVIMTGDWNDRLRLDIFEAYALAGDFLEPSGILINGLGPQFNNNITNTPMANFVVEKGKRHRFRFINVGFFDCPLEFSIEEHKMTIIAVDGYDVQPVEVDSFVSSSGERFDFIINANQPKSTYYIKVKGYLLCERLKTFTLATLQYKGSNLVLPSEMPTYDNSAPTGGVLLNPISKNNATGYSKVLNIDELRSVHVSEYGLNTKNPYKYYITVDMSGIDHPTFQRYPYYSYNDVDPNFAVRTPQLNRITHKNLDVPLLPARNTLQSSEFCNEESMRDQDCKNKFCECPHVIQVPLGAVVELVFVELFDQDDSPTLHPLHLHGHSYRVVGVGEFGRNFTRAQIIEMDRKGMFKRNYYYPPLKDTVAIPKGGYAIVRFIADNPGFWLMHCHIDTHASEGMAFVLQVGDVDEMPEAPENFPVCGNWPHYLN